MRRILIFFWAAGLASLQATAAPATEVPFDFLHNQIVLRGTLAGGGPYNFILDTGTYTSTIDLALARRLGLPLGDPGAVAGAGSGRATGRRVTCPELRIGDLAVRGLNASALDLSGMSRSLGRPLDGVLGFSFLDGRGIEIDYFLRKIRFLADSRQPEQRPDDARTISFPMQFREGSVLPVIEDCYVNGVRLPLTLDTGSSLGLILFPRAVRQLGLRELAQTGIPMTAAGYLGQARLTKGWVASVKLKSIDLGAIEAAYVERGYGDNEDPARRAGNLGNAALQDFMLTLDYRNRTVTLRKTSD